MTPARIFGGGSVFGEPVVTAGRHTRTKATLERIRGFGFDTDIDEAFQWLVESLAETLKSSAARN